MADEQHTETDAAYGMWCEMRRDLEAEIEALRTHYLQLAHTTFEAAKVMALLIWLEGRLARYTAEATLRWPGRP